MRTPPPGFLADLQRRFPDVRDLRWNDAVGRWELISDSLAGQPVSQFWGWFRDPKTNVPLAPDPVTGLYPFRDLDLEGQAALVSNLERGFQLRGARGWRDKIRQRTAWNTAERAKRTRARAETFAHLIAECDLRRPWKRDHEWRPGQGRLVIPTRGLPA